MIGKGSGRVDTAQGLCLPLLQEPPPPGVWTGQAIFRSLSQTVDIFQHWAIEGAGTAGPGIWADPVSIVAILAGLVGPAL